MKGELVFFVLGLGLLVTMLSGFYGRAYSSATETGRAYGLPLSWHGQRTLADPSTSSLGWFAWSNFVYDTALWSMIFGIFALMFRKSKRDFTPPKKVDAKST